METPSNDGKRHDKSISESQRALELRKFFTPYLSHSKIHKETAFNESLNNDGALSAYAETIIWRLGGVHSMVSLVDRAEQYFIAGATRIATTDGDELVDESSNWFGCDTVPTPGGLCENTLALDVTKDPYPCFVINDLSHDERFASLPVVDGSIASYRFYAGTPITTQHGINIGSFFIFDDKPRDGLGISQRKYLHATAAKVMKHLETKREAAERRRVVMMSQGISKFLVQTAPVIETVSAEPSVIGHEGSTDEKLENDPTPPVDIELTDPSGTAIALRKQQRGNETVLDKIQLTLDHAAEVLRESLELNVGGVAFLDTAIGYTDAGDTVPYTAEIEEKEAQKSVNVDGVRPSLRRQADKTGRQLSRQSVRSSDDQHKSAKVMAMSASPIASWNQKSSILNGKTLQSLISSYPKGNIWYIDDEGYFSSLEQINELATSAATSPSGRRRSVPTIDMTKQNAEATLLAQVFHKARQIMFLPLWDAGGERWYSGCFVWSRSAVPVFTVESEIAYLSAFTNSVMVELSRLDAITSNKMKSDFISSISHEFRSPLHGILASAEFLRDSDLDASQIEFISTIQKCSGTLLDTINHVLDYSKINSFENAGNQQGNISNELYQVTNLALLCEDLVNGMMAAGEFRGAGSADFSIPVSNDFTHQDARRASHPLTKDAVEIIMDIEDNNWFYKVQAGALRRVIMNIFGNAQKYTDSGYILVEVRIQKDSQDRPQISTITPRDVLLIHIRDTGRGMSSEYMGRKLYHPFAQEDSFAPGVGLGLSIVWSIINQLGGKIHIRSEIGKGTDVEITLPVDRPDGSEASARPDDLAKISADAQEAINSLRERAAGKLLLIARRNQHDGLPRHHDVSWACIERYCVNWFGYQVITHQDSERGITADLVITDHEGDWSNPDSEVSHGQRILVVHEHMIFRPHHKQGQRPIGTICTPIGPFKLARSIVSLLDQEMPSRAPKASNTSDRGTQTPLASPEDRMLSNGLPMTDYGFTTPLISPLTPVLPILEAQIPLDSVVIPSSPQVSQVSHGPSAQDDDARQAIANLSAISLRMPSRFVKRTQTSPVVPTISNLATSNGIKPASPADPTNALHILAVDDNKLNLQLIHRYLLKRKVDTIITARNGVEAVATVREEANKGKNFDVIFMDISMPEMDGFEATRLIRSFERSFAHRSISEEAGWYFNWGEEIEKAEETIKVRGRTRAYIVALTGLASRRDRDEAESSGFDDFLTKPIAFAKIGELLKRLSDEKGGSK